MPPAPDAEPAPAKINLYLHVLGRRADGYHTLDSLAVFAGAADRLTAAPADSLALAVTGPFAAALDGHPNLVLRAATALAEAAGIHAGARLTLEKTLPVASGIGGGSADAAATLRLLIRQWRAKLGAEARHALAARLGADVPVCLAGRPARMAGIGDVLAPAPALPPFGIALLNPGIAVPTGPVFAARTGPFSAPATLPAAWRDAAAMTDDLRTLANDLEAPACALHPAIPQALAALAAQRGCLLARMSGSGATCFALFATPALAATAAARAARPGWWAWGGGAYEAPV